MGTIYQTLSMQLKAFLEANKEPMSARMSLDDGDYEVYVRKEMRNGEAALTIGDWKERSSGETVTSLKIIQFFHDAHKLNPWPHTYIDPVIDHSLLANLLFRGWILDRIFMAKVGNDGSAVVYRPKHEAVYVSYAVKDLTYAIENAPNE